jgi:hypothetical protein
VILHTSFLVICIYVKYSTYRGHFDWLWINVIGRSVGIVRLRTKGHGVCFYQCNIINVI